MRLNSLIICFLIAMTYTIQAQDIASHKWKNRLVLILTDDIGNATFENQIQELKEDIDGLNERKLLIYQIDPSRYKIGFNKSDWTASKTLYEKFKEEETTFEVLLIGLDGGIKLRQSELLTREKLYAIIDGMPMRRAEIRNQRNREN